MKTLSSPKQAKGMNMVELFIVMSVFSIMALLLLPALTRPRTTSHRINCVNNLKQIGLAFKCWSLDSSDKFPMEVSTNSGGSKELAVGPQMFTTFMVMSNELSTPKLLLCPLDVKRKAATNFEPGLANSNLSYFVGVDASDTNATMLLSGDRNLTNRVVLKRGLLEAAPGQPVGWTQELHQNAGNILLADGSVQQQTTVSLRNWLQTSGANTNRLAMP